jgi:hypothetical protein
MSRRLFLLSAAALPIGCAANRESRRDGGLTPASPTVRQPVVGQSWRYAKHDIFTKALVDTQVDAVTAVGSTVELGSSTEGRTGAEAPATDSLRWIRKYFDHPSSGRMLPGEVQDPWGRVVVDPHWNQVQVYETPIPLWPTRLEPGWHTHIVTKYKTSNAAGLPWEQTMKAEEWQSIAVPAGRFTALKYVNVINFASSDPSRTDSVRREAIWFAPEIGRWVARESHGTYYFDESVADDQNNESGYRWELLAWT